MDDSKPSRKRPRTKSSRKNVAVSSSSQLSDNDLRSLDSFCSDLNFEEISFESWQKTQSDLDLVVPIWIDAELARVGGEAVVRYSRTIRETLEAGVQRRSVSVKISIPAAVGDGHRIICAAHGDQIANQVGSLVVVLKIR